MFLQISAIFLGFLMLIMILVIKKSTEEGYLAFLSPFIRFSKSKILSEKMENIEEKGYLNKRQLSKSMIEIRNLNKKQGLLELEKEESAINDLFEKQYEKILQFLQDDLREFFENYKILWDVENIKSILNLSKNISFNDFLKIMGPTGFLDLKTLKIFLDTGKLVENLMLIFDPLPKAFSNKINFERSKSVVASDFEFSLDLAAFRFLKEKSSEIKTKNVSLTWNMFEEIYEIKNIINMARLKYSTSGYKNLNAFIFPLERKLNHNQIDLLIKSDSYHNFLKVLRQTYYGNLIPIEDIEPFVLESALKKLIQKSKFEETISDVTNKSVIRFLLEMETEYDLIRRSVFHKIIKSYN